MPAIRLLFFLVCVAALRLPSLLCLTRFSGPSFSAPGGPVAASLSPSTICNRPLLRAGGFFMCPFAIYTLVLLFLAYLMCDERCRCTAAGVAGAVKGNLFSLY